jgi:uncharacterized membrane protein YphA (DoxX/SURF4 family)
MTKAQKITYWVATIWLSLGMMVSGVMQFIQHKDEIAILAPLDYPDYFYSIIGAWKLLVVIAILSPKFPLIKEWAYAGFFFVSTGAIFSHYAVQNTADQYIGPILLLILTVLSWYLRPANKKLSS